MMLLGPTLNAKVAFELSERISHLGLRMKEHSHRTLVYVTRMKKLGIKVIYRGLEDHPDHIYPFKVHDKQREWIWRYPLQNGTHFGFMAVSLGYYI